MRVLVMVAIGMLLFATPAQVETIGDVDGDDKVGLEESIYSLQVVSGLQPENIERLTLNVTSAFRSSLPGLGTVVGWIKDRIGILSKDRVVVTVENLTVSTDELIKSVSDGTLQAVHGYAGYHNIPAAVLFGAIPFGPEVIEYLAWLYHGNGLTLWQKLYDDNNFNVKVLPCGAGTAETGGWYKKPVNVISDFTGLRIRSCGLAALILEKVGATTECYPGGQIISKFLDGSLDAAEFSTPAVDASFLNFPSVASYNYFPGWHQPAIILELIVNKDIWDGLTSHQQMAIDMTCRAATMENVTYSEAIQAQYILDNAQNGVQNLYFSESILAALKIKATEVMVEQSSADADFNTIWNDYSQFHQKYSTWLDLGFNPRR